MGAAASAQGDDAWALYRRGMEERAAGRLDAAIAMLDRALQRRPDFPEALCAGAYILQMRGHAAGALAFYERALTLQPDDAVAWFNRGGLLMAAGRAEDALQSLERACALQPDNAGFHCNRGGALFDLGQLAEASEAFERAATLDPGLAKARLNLGNALMRLGFYHDAREAYLRAIAIEPVYALAYCGLGIVSKELGLFDDAMRAFDQALAFDPNSEEARSNKGCLQLLLGDFASGWEGYEYRWTKGKRPVPVSSARFNLGAPESLAGRKILIVNDHGLGDTIQFFRYVALLARAGAQVTFAGPRKMRRLLASAGAPVVWRDECDLSGDFDAVLAISSLPRACGTRLDNIPAETPYLFAEPDRHAVWRGRLCGEGLKVGLCWRGNVDFRVDPRRSIPPEALTPLAGLEGARLFSLQKGARAEELPPELARKVENLGEEPDSGPYAFIDTAAMMTELDLIVTCDTSIAHLAGALGRPVWVALRHIAEWRWLDGREDSPWYPKMRLFRCARGDDWAEPLGRMAGQIRKAWALQ
ncbi:tetratricopeptide repeat-containing glycosyltransferase family protein [Rhodoblastus sp. 17X3]|uniref:tetratricopeptide repeat-containing glycosyltransferase family protein n=1 Tax=Rhodoblastus sp. 17X3 TaxID=3047026 RepID=UPI0024B77034|nr:tetratricopeptide repeat-containing glycosyltransferase family protein [Rhodoblastus sp. 17X3]MDI9848925.1 tetratricopeptide repeat-containing glycosyltransferase family protein [Rhodoblastus sp. 17X3]